jgi:hypothetical protein
MPQLGRVKYDYDLAVDNGSQAVIGDVEMGDSKW